MSALLGPDGKPARGKPGFGFEPVAEEQRTYAADRPRRRAYFPGGQQPNVDAEADTNTDHTDTVDGGQL